jgi:hypothetical protein
LVYVFLLDRRYRLLALDEEREEREVALAIAERVAAHRPPAAPAGSESSSTELPAAPVGGSTP